MRWWEALGAALQLSLAGEGVGRRCNGHAALCHRRYSNISWIGAHNSAFVGQSAFNNQGATVRQQLEKGVRFLQAQTRNKEGQIEMCHTYCWARDAGPLRGYLGEVADWLRRRPDEVLTLLLTNYEAIPVESYDAEFAAAGLKPYLFRPGRVLAKEEWPTLQTMIGAGERLVVFMDYHADQNKVDYILDEFDYFWETPFGITDKNFPTCEVQRPLGVDVGRLMGIMNHMLNFRIGHVVFPDRLDADKTNSLASIQKQVELCRRLGRPQPNVVLV